MTYTGRTISLTKFAAAASECGRISSQPVLSAFHPILFFSWRRAWTLLQVWGVEGGVHCFWFAKEGSRALSCQATGHCHALPARILENTSLGLHCSMDHDHHTVGLLSLCVCVCLHKHVCVCECKWRLCFHFPATQARIITQKL